MPVYTEHMDFSHLFSDSFALYSTAGGFVLGVVVGLTLLSYPLKRILSRKVEVREDQFVALTSHYLRTPLSVIQVASSELQEQDDQLTAKERTHLYEVIASGTQRLWIVSEQLTVVGEVDQGTLQLQYDVNDLSAVVSESMSFMDPFARPKALHFTLADNSGDIREMRFDRRRIKQALIALLDNAVKFSPDNGLIAVTIGREANIFYVRIEDQGTGMPGEIISHLTEKFYRGTKLYNFDYEGLGLGLHIAQAIVTLHGGSVSFQSKPKRGTIALLQLPML